MNRRIEKLIPDAIDVVKEVLEKDEKVASEYNGYIASFGASIITSGLLPAIAFYESESSGAQKDRKKLMTAIRKLIKKTKKESDNNETLMKYVLPHKNDLSEIKEEITDAAIALKLAIRTFELKKGD